MMSNFRLKWPTLYSFYSKISQFFRGRPPTPKNVCKPLLLPLKLPRPIFNPAYFKLPVVYAPHLWCAQV